MTDNEMTESYNLAAAVGSTSNEVTPDELPPAAVSIEADQRPAEEDNVESPEQDPQPMHRSVPESLRGSLEYANRPEQLQQPVPQVQQVPQVHPLSEIQVAQHTRWQQHTQWRQHAQWQQLPPVVQPVTSHNVHLPLHRQAPSCIYHNTGPRVPLHRAAVPQVTSQWRR